MKPPWLEYPTSLRFEEGRAGLVGHGRLSQVKRVEPTGLEPVTFGVPRRRSPS